MGFQHMRRAVHEAASRKGGKIRVRKGIGLMHPDKVKEITTKGGLASADSRKKGKIKPIQGINIADIGMEDLY